jgi:hypothetical protein
MLVPTPPTIKPLQRISPMLYETALKCIARTAWLATGDRRSLPAHPRALLGIALHAVLERARAVGILGDNTEHQRTEAARIFDEKMEELFAVAHPLLHAKFESRERLPFYNLYQARAAQIALDTVAGSARSDASQAKGVPASRPNRSVEAPLISKDQRIGGRPDVVDAASATVTDYKGGDPLESGEISENEARQLRLYAFLANEHGIPIRRGVIERADRTRVELRISPADAVEESTRAIAALDKYNSYAGKPFVSAASPSPENCRLCPCIAFCEAFWQNAGASWAAQCGTHIEGVVEAIDQGEDALLSIRLHVTRGTGLLGSGILTRLSRDWLNFGGSEAPIPGQTVRITDATYVNETAQPAIFGADRKTTAVWIVPTITS